LKIWVPADILTYGFIPFEARLVFVDCIELIWCIILTKTTGGHGGGHSDKTKENTQIKE
jgi:hypothetical protein